jgi:hypothetical protein
LTPVNLGEDCDDPAVSCALGNGGPSAICGPVPMDEVNKCQCPPMFTSRLECLREYICHYKLINFFVKPNSKNHCTLEKYIWSLAGY